MYAVSPSNRLSFDMPFLLHFIKTITEKTDPLHAISIPTAISESDDLSQLGGGAGAGAGGERGGGGRREEAGKESFSPKTLK